MQFKLRRARALTTLTPALGLVLGVVGCGNTNPDQDNPDINVNPLTHDEAAVSLQRITQRAGDPLAQSALRQMMPALDRLNGLVARVEVAPGSVVSFYEPIPGQITISERGPVDGQHVLSAAQSKDLSVLDLYRQLAKAEPPAALVAAHNREVAGVGHDASEDLVPGQAASSPASGNGQLVQNGDTSTATSALTADDGQYWRDWGCFLYGPGNADIAGCYPNWANGGYYQANTKTSFFAIAPYAGGPVSIRMQYNGKTAFTNPAFVDEWDGWWAHSSTYSNVNGPQYNVKLHRWDILNASGAQFHWAVAFKWNCSNTWPCDQWPVND
jgi:hypothetical protein